MAQHGISRQKKSVEPEATESHHNKLRPPAYNKAQVPEDDLLDRLLATPPGGHAAMLTEVSSDEQRTRIAASLQRSFGNAYVQRLVHGIQRRSPSKAPAPAATSVASPEEEEQQAPTTEAATETTPSSATETRPATPARPAAEPAAPATGSPTGTAREEQTETPTGTTPAREASPPAREEQAPAAGGETPTSSTTEETAEAPTGERGTESATETRELEPAIEIQRREELARLRARWETWAISAAQRAEAAIGRTPPDYHTAGNYISNVRFEVQSMLENPRVPDEVKERIRLTGNSVDLAEQTLNTLQRPDGEVTHRIGEVLGLVALDYVFGT